MAEKVDMGQVKEKFLKILMSQVGKPYIFGAEVKMSDENPPAFDCSELIEWSFFRGLGIDMVDGAHNQYNVTVPVETPEIGDLGFLMDQGTKRVHHVVIATGPRHIVHAKGAEFGVVREEGAQWAERNKREFAGWRRYMPARAVLEKEVPDA